MQCSVSSDYGTSILNSSEININEHNDTTITITSYHGLLSVGLLNKTVVCYSPFTNWGQPELLSAAQNISNNMKGSCTFRAHTRNEMPLHLRFNICKGSFTFRSQTRNEMLLINTR